MGYMFAIDGFEEGSEVLVPLQRKYRSEKGPKLSHVARKGQIEAYFGETLQIR